MDNHAFDRDPLDPGPPCTSEEIRRPNSRHTAFCFSLGLCATDYAVACVVRRTGFPVIHLHTVEVEHGDQSLREACRPYREVEPCLDVNLRPKEVVVGESLVVEQNIQVVVEGILEVEHQSVEEVVLEGGSFYPFEISSRLHLRLKCSRLCVRGIPVLVGRSSVPSLLVVKTFVVLDFDSRRLSRPRIVEV